jgi:sec-independent protein translocase protein TatA
MGNVGPFQIIIVLGLALLLFGAGRIADIGKGLGEGIRNFKRGIKDEDDPPPKQLPKKGSKAAKAAKAAPVVQDDEDDEGDDEGEEEKPG